MDIKCDRCGETFDLRDYTMLSSIQMTVSSIGCPQKYEFNLCPSCMAKLNDSLKLRRALDGTNPTPKSVEECLENIQEEMADVFVCLTMFGKSAERDGILIYNRYMEKVIKIEDEKEARWLSRLEEKENKNG